MQGGSVRAGIFGGLALAAAAVAHTGTARADNSFAATVRGHLGFDAPAYAFVDLRGRPFDRERLDRVDAATRGRHAFTYLASLPTPRPTSVELDLRPILRQVIGRRLIAQDGFNLYVLRGREVLSAEIGATRLGIVPSGLSLRQGTTLTLFTVF